MMWSVTALLLVFLVWLFIESNAAKIVLGLLIAAVMLYRLSNYMASRRNMAIANAISQHKKILEASQQRCEHPYIRYWKNGSAASEIFGIVFSECLVCRASPAQRSSRTICVQETNGAYRKIRNPDRAKS
jgi:hypothetical protein